MPGPGQGKQTQKKKWHESACNLNESMTAVNAVMTVPSTPAPTATTATSPKPPGNTIPPASTETLDSAGHMSTVPMLLTIPEIGQFCNPTTARSSAIIFNDLLRTTILELIENAKTKAFEEGRREGYYEGYEEGRYLANEDEQCDIFETLRKEDEEKAQNNTFEDGKKEGEERGRMAERKEWEMKNTTPTSTVDADESQTIMDV